jgi:hypothetical protein
MTQMTQICAKKITYIFAIHKKDSRFRAFALSRLRAIGKGFLNANDANGANLRKKITYIFATR